MKYKVGDHVRIKSIDWYNENKDENGNVHCGDKVFDNYMSVFCGSVVTIGGVYPYTAYDIQEDMHCRAWTDEMIEGFAEEETSQNAKLVSERFSEYVNPSEFKYTQDTITKMLLQGANIPNEYILKDENDNVINATKIVLEKKRKEYPKTYEECIGKLPINWDGKVEGYKCDLLTTFQKLLICRDAYWKIAGNELGLSEPWKPDWEYDDTKYVLFFNKNEICHEMMRHTSYVLAFPTAEMRDAFYENFKELIEICKEFL